MPAHGADAAHRAALVTPTEPHVSQTLPARIRSPTPKLRAYVALAAVGAVAGLALGVPQLVALAVPFAAYAAIGLMLARPPELNISASIERHTVLEGEPFEVALELRAAGAIEVVELALAFDPGVGLFESEPPAPMRIPAEQPRRVALDLYAPRWGARRLGAVTARTRDRFGLVEYKTGAVPLGAIRALPTRESLRVLLDPLELQATTGSRTARDRAEGLEFAENRPFLPGDRLRRINWRATARRGTPFVAERHPERNADVILFMDTFAEARDSHGGSTLALAVRASTSLAAAYLTRRDRVGVVGFGGTLMGLRPRLGLAQVYRIIDALLGSEVVFSYAHKDVTFVPRGLLPPKALIIGITPLIDERYIGALLDLRARGFDLTVVEISPVPFTASGKDAEAALARRLWQLQREALRARLNELGVPVAQWAVDEPLQAPLVTAAELKRRARRPLAA